MNASLKKNNLDTKRQTNIERQIDFTKKIYISVQRLTLITPDIVLVIFNTFLFFTPNLLLIRPKITLIDKNNIFSITEI